MAAALWLALLLACGQTVATVHLLSHAGAQVAAPVKAGQGDASLERFGCELCLLAVTLGTAAPALQVRDAGPVALRHAAPRAQPGTSAAVAPRLAYRSRAPPSSLR